LTATGIRTDPLAVVRKFLAGIAIGLGSAFLVILVAWSGWLDTAELKTYDWRMRTLREWSPSVNPDIVLVEINDATIRDMQEIAGRWPWPRALSAVLIDYLHRGAPKVIAVDIGFWEKEREGSYPFNGEDYTSGRSDGELVEAVKRAGNVVLLADAVNPGLVGGEVQQQDWLAPPYRLGPEVEERPVITLPYDTLAAAAAGFGHNFLAIDRDGPARRMLPFVRKGARFMPSLGMAAALVAGGYRPEDVVLDGGEIRIGDRHVPLVRLQVTAAADASKRHDQQTMLINYRAHAQMRGARTYPTYEVRHLLQSEGQLREGEKPEVDPAVFKDKVVFVGLTASGLLDMFQTPFGGGTMPGIQLHASIADSVLSDRFIALAPAWSAVAVTVAGALLTGLMSAALPFAAAAIGAAALIAGWTGASLVAFDRGLSVSMAEPMAATAVALFAGTAYRYFVEDAEKRKVSRLFGRYVSRDVYTQLMAHPELAALGGGRREMSVLFSDLRGFTSITEKGNPEDLVTQLNEYFTRMVEIVFRNGGTVDKFVGDMVMALFGAPLDDVDHADDAVTTAVEMVRELNELNRRWAAEGRVQLDIGIGVNSGGMIAGNIGSSAIMSYTVIGDNVNLGARLESLNKEYRTRIIISEATRARLSRSYELRPLGGVVVKGKTRPVDIFEVIVPSPLVAGDRETPAAPAEEEEKTV
jgi:adenylate cyclase